jgi:hypothetical protein
MTAPTQSQVHIDAAMTNLSIAYRNANYIAGQIFPVVPVQHQSDKFFVFDKASWFRDEAGPRAPGTTGPVVEYSISSSTYSCVPYSATKLVPDEIVDNADQPLQVRQAAVEFATDKLLLRLERDVAGNVFGTGWTSCTSNSSGTYWSDEASEPIEQVEIAKETIVSVIGREPNVMVVGREVWTDIKNHPDIIARMRSDERGIVTPEIAADIFGIEKFLVGSAIYTTTVEGNTMTGSYVWGKYAWIGWVPNIAGLMNPAAGYIFTHRNRVVYRFRREEETTDAYRAEMHWDCKLTCPDAGYLIKTVTA